jgi:hypothetical protein
MPSTVIRRITYDEPAQRLRVQFVSGALYDYFAVPRPIYEAFIRAPSKGRYFATHVRDRFDFALLSKAEEGSFPLRYRPGQAAPS